MHSDLPLVKDTLKGISHNPRHHAHVVGGHLASIPKPDVMPVVAPTSKGIAEVIHHIDLSKVKAPATKPVFGMVQLELH